jgi:hypothetical protein
MKRTNSSVFSQFFFPFLSFAGCVERVCKMKSDLSASSSQFLPTNNERENLREAAWKLSTKRRVMGILKRIHSNVQSVHKKVHTRKNRW